jgi:hypothetical protein
MKELMTFINLDTDTLLFRRGLRETVVEVEKRHANCTITNTFFFADSEGLIIKKMMDGIVMGVPDENGD